MAVFQKTIPVIFGPTASGKSDLAMALCKAISGEVISADSRQIYRGLDIGTGKVHPSRRMGIEHHLVDIRDPNQPFSVAEFVSLAHQSIQTILGRGRIPVIAGGTGLYLKAMMEGLHQGPGSDPLLRERLLLLAQTKGTEYLHTLLHKADPVSASKIGPCNQQRLIRALEICELTDPAHSPNQISEKSDTAEKYHFTLFLLTGSRKVLYERINLRVSEMIMQGLFHEVRNLADQWGEQCPAFNTIGYSEILDFFQKPAISKDQIIEKIKQNSRKYAKRQITWMRHSFEKKGISIPDDYDLNEKVAKIVEIINCDLTVRSGFPVR